MTGLEMQAVTGEQFVRDHKPTPIGWLAVAQTLNRPYPVTIPMVSLVMLVPLYLVIANVARDGTSHAPAFWLDSVIPLQPTWALIYGALYAFLIVLPVLAIRQQDHIRRTVFAYLTVWIVAYICFLIYPTVAPRPDKFAGEGFAAWGLNSLYGADPPYNCFPSIHVAHSFVSALTCYRLHRRLGIAATFCASLVALSTLFTKQHYVVDVIGGVLLALVAYTLFLKSYRRNDIPALDRRLAPVLALGVMAISILGVAMFWVVYRVQTGA